MRRRPGRMFSTTATVDVDVDLDESELNEAGWFYREEGDLAVPDGAFDRAARAIASEHREHHAGSIPMCKSGVCAGLDYDTARSIEEVGAHV